MTSAAVLHPSYHDDFLHLDQQMENNPLWLRELRESAWERFDTLGFPTARRGNERWKYTSVAPIARREFRRRSAPPGHQPRHPSEVTGLSVPAPDYPSSWLELVNIDGQQMSAFQRGAQPPVSDDGRLTICTLGQALAAESEEVRERLALHAPYSDDGFVALNTAFIHDGAYVRLPDDYPEPVCVSIAYVSNGDELNVTHPRTLIIAGRNTVLTVVESYVGTRPTAGSASELEQAAVQAADPGYFTNAVTEVAVGPGANVEHYRVMRESPRSYHVGTTRVAQERDSSYTSGSFTVGSRLGRHDLSVLMDAPGCYCSLNGLYLTADQQHVDNLINIDHAMPHCTSRLNYKGILDGNSRAVFGGEVLVREHAQKSDARQSDKNLLLSDHAEVDSKPSLLIYADDVKCSHGATAGHIDEDTLFYLRSRGLDLDEASRMLVQAFASEIIDSVRPEPLRDHLDVLFSQAIPEKSLSFGRKT